MVKGLGLRKSCPISAKWEHWRHLMAMGLPSEGCQHGARVLQEGGQSLLSFFFFFSPQEDFTVFRDMYISLSLSFFYLLPLHGCHAEIVQMFLRLYFWWV